MSGAKPPRTFEELKDTALAYGEKHGHAKLGVAAAWDKHVLEATYDAWQLGLVDPVLVGVPDLIERAAGDAGIDISSWETVPVEAPDETTAMVLSARRAVELVREGRVDFLMKGKMQTADIMRAALNKETGIRAGGLMRHLAILWTPTYGRLLCMSDGGIVLKPDLVKKKQMIENSVDAMHKLGWECPNVAIVGAIELVNPDMQHTLDAAALAKMNERGQITGCVVDGPFGLDNAISEKAARVKGMSSSMAGKADLVIFADIDVGNVFYKALCFMTEGVRTSGVLLGSKVPIVMASRADGPDTKRNSIIVGTVIAHATKL